MSEQVLLIVPSIHDFAAYDLWLKPLGLLYVAAAVERAGYSVRVVNCLDRLHPVASNVPGPRRSRSHSYGRGKFSYEVVPKPVSLSSVPRKFKRYGIPIAAFRQLLSEGPPPDVIGVGSMMTYWYGGVAEAVSILRESYPGVPIVLGGIYATLCPEHARKRIGADETIKGPGETQFLEALEHFSGKPTVRDVRPQHLRPAYHLLRKVDSVSMLTSFGCPFSCSYCASGLIRRGFLQRSANDVAEEISHYVTEMGVRDIAFYDDALLVKPERHIKPILQLVIQAGLRPRFHTPNGLHADMIDEETADLMKRSGFVTVRLSLEGVGDRLIKDSCCKVDPGRFERAVANLRSAGYACGEIEAYILMGAPGQTAADVRQAIRFVHEAGAVARLADFSPIPGTEYFDSAVEQYGFDPDEPLFQNSSVLPHLVPGLHQEYQELKALGRSMNEKLVNGANSRNTSPS